MHTVTFRRSGTALAAWLLLSLVAGCSHSAGPAAGRPGGAPTAGGAAQKLLNVSYDPTRELYDDYDGVFVKHWQDTNGQSVSIQKSNGGSGKQAQSVINGLSADVVTLGIASDINAIQQRGLIKPGWDKNFPNNSCPYTSTIVFLVRTGNPKNIKDWPDLIRPGVSVITPNPKSSSGGRWSYLAAWGQALQASHGDQAVARDYVTKLYKNVPVLDSGARGATQTFVQRGVGDVLLAWENEAYLAVNEIGKGKFQIVEPSSSILAEPPVAVVDQNVDAHGTRAVATEYLKYLYSPAGQDLVAKHYYRPSDPAVAKKYAAQFPTIPLFTVEKLFGPWDAVQKAHFADGAIFDQIYAKR